MLRKRDWLDSNRDRAEAEPVARVTLQLMEHRWLQALGSPLDDKMCQLLMHICLNEIKGRPISKMAALKSVGLTNKKNIKKYLSKAMEDGLIEMCEGGDRRKHFLIPSAKLRGAVIMEFGWLASRFKGNPFEAYMPIEDTDLDRDDYV
jgi:hypothetical protein